MTKRAVLYSRVSNDDTKQDGRNLEHQITMGQEFAEKRGYLIVAKLKEDDKGANSADINLPRLNELREMARTKQFDVLIVRELDRLSRSLAKQLIIEEELKRQGVEIEYVLGEYPDTPEGNFMRHIRATVAEYEREKISERAVRGRYNKVKSGSVFVGKNAPYGYKVIENDGRYELEIFEPEAAIVRQMFELYVGGMSFRKIAHRLNDEGVPTYTDNRPDAALRQLRKREQGIWRSGTVRRLMMNESYIGKWHYGKRMGRSQRKARAKEEWVEVAVPAIVSQELWDAVVRLRENNRSVRVHETGYDYLLKGMITCAYCDHRVGARTAHVDGKVYPYYRCNAYKRELVDECENARNYYQAELVDFAVWEWLKSILTNPEELNSGLQVYQTEREKLVAPLRERLKLVNEMVEPERSKLTRLLDLYLSGEFSKDMLTDRKTRLEARIRALDKEKVELEAALEAQSLSDEQVELVQSFSKEIMNGLDITTTDKDAMRHILNILDVQVKLSTDGDDRIAEVQCGIGKEILSLTTPTTNGAVGRRAALFSTPVMRYRI